MPLEQLTLDRVTRVSRLEHVIIAASPAKVIREAIASVGRGSVLVAVDRHKCWSLVRTNDSPVTEAESILDRIIGSGTVYVVSDEDFATLESMVECKACLEHGTGACQGTLCGG
jgi:hypothetical protein